MPKVRTLGCGLATGRRCFGKQCNQSGLSWSRLWFTHVSTIADFIINYLYLTTSCSWLCTVGSTVHLHATCASTHAGEWHRLWSERQRTIEAMFWGVSIRVSLLSGKNEWFGASWFGIQCLLIRYPCSVFIPFILKKTQIPNHLAPQKTVSSSLYEVLKVAKIPQRLEVSSLQRAGVFVQLPNWVWHETIQAFEQIHSLQLDKIHLKRGEWLVDWFVSTVRTVRYLLATRH